MRIALLARAGSIHTVRWANALAERGVDVDLLSAHEGSPMLSPGVRVYRLPVRPRLGYFLNVVPLRRWLRRIRPDILHAHYASSYGTLGRLSGYRPWVLSVWGADVYDFPGRSPWNRHLLLANLRAADYVCSTSQVMAAHTQSLCPGIRDLAVTPFGVDVVQFGPRPQLRDGTFITIGTVKMLTPKYGIDTLIQGFARCRELLHAERNEAANRLKLRIVGSGPQRNALQRLANELGVAEATCFVGQISHSEVADQLNQLDVYVAVSRLESESFGVAVIEASSCRLPVVVSNVGGLPEVVLDGKTGFVIAKEDPEALAHTLSRLIRNSDLRRELGAAGRQHVVDHYDWRENVSRMERVYREVMTRSHAGALPKVRGRRNGASIAHKLARRCTGNGVSGNPHEKQVTP